MMRDSFSFVVNVNWIVASHQRVLVGMRDCFIFILTNCLAFFSGAAVVWAKSCSCWLTHCNLCTGHFQSYSFSCHMSHHDTSKKNNILDSHHRHSTLIPNISCHFFIGNYVGHVFHYYLSVCLGRFEGAWNDERKSRHL